MLQNTDRMTPEGTPARPERPALAGHPGLTTSLWVVLGLLAAVTPFATEFYLPAFPQMVKDLGTSPTGIQLTLSAYFVGIAVGQLLFGPLSDRLGRRGPLIAGTSICLIAAVASALAPNVEVLVAARFVQALAGAAGMVIGRAVISDVAVGREAARAFSLMMMVLATAPIVAPIAGSLLATTVGWRGILWTVCAMIAVMLAAVVLFVPESYPRERREHARAVNAGARPVVVALRSRTYVGNMLAFAMSFAALMAYMSASPFVFQVMAGLSPVAYGILYGIIALVLVLSSAVSARFTASHAVGGLLGLGITVFVAATRSNEIWILPLTAKGGVTKAGLFTQLPCPGPDGIAMDVKGNLSVAHPGLGIVWLFDKRGLPIGRVESCAGDRVLNIAYGGPENDWLYITESVSGSVLRAKMPAPGVVMFSHSEG